MERFHVSHTCTCRFPQRSSEIPKGSQALILSFIWGCLKLLWGAGTGMATACQQASQSFRLTSAIIHTQGGQGKGVKGT